MEALLAGEVPFDAETMAPYLLDRAYPFGVSPVRLDNHADYCDVEEQLRNERG